MFKLETKYAKGTLKTSITLGLALMPLLAAPLVAWACSCARLEQWGFLGAEGLQPANTRGLLWHGVFSGSAEPQALPVQILDDKGQALPVSFEAVATAPTENLWLFRPAAGLLPGKTYTFLTTTGYQKTPQNWQISLAPLALQAPSEPLALKVGPSELGPVRVLTRAGMCSEQVRAYQLPVEMVLPAAMQPFKQQLFYQTLIDGKTLWQPQSSLCDVPRPGESWQGLKGLDLLYTACEGGKFSHGLTPGKHQLQIRALLPGSEVLIESETIDVQMQCPGPPAS